MDTMGGGRIDCYLDIGALSPPSLRPTTPLTRRAASLFSYVAFVDLLNNLELLAANGVQVESVPPPVPQRSRR